MGSAILGFLLGLLIVSIVISIGCTIYDNCYKRWTKIVCIIVMISLCLISIVAITFGTCNYNKLQSTCYISEYKVTKKTIEESIKNIDITGLERFQLVDSAIEENKKLIQNQFDCQQWYGFLIDKDVLDLEPISFN